MVMALRLVIAASFAVCTAASEACDASADGATCEQDGLVDSLAQVGHTEVDGNQSNELDPEMEEFLNRSLARKPVQLSWDRLGLVAVMLGLVLAWIVCIIKFAIDGSLPARMAMWGLLPEVCAAVSVRSMIALMRLKTNPTPAIVLRQCVDNAGAKQLADAIRQYGKTARLEVIELPSNPNLGEEGLREIVSAIAAPDSDLAELDLSYNPQLGDTIITCLRPLLELKTSKLEVLKIGACDISAKGFETFATYVAKSRVRTLDLGRNDLSGQGEVFETLCDAPMLEELTLICCSLQVSDVRTLAVQLPFTSIRSLHLGGNGFGNEGLQALAEHLPKCLIDELGLECNEIEYKALSVLGTAWVKRPFSRLSLKGNNMSQEEIVKFTQTLRSLSA